MRYVIKLRCGNEMEEVRAKTRKINLKKVLSDKEKLKEAVLSEYCRMAFDDIGNYIEISKDEEGEIIVRYKEGKAFRTGNISEITRNRNGFKFKLYSKENALVRLGMYLGLWKEKPEEGDAEDIKSIEALLEEDDGG